MTYVAATATEPARWPRSDMRLFHLYCEDGRELVATDNRALAARQADRRRGIRLHTIGGDVAKIVGAGPGAAGDVIDAQFRASGELDYAFVETTVR